MIKDLAKPGDILLYRVTSKSGWISKLIASVQLWRSEGDEGPQYSHCAIVDMDRIHMVEAYWPRVRRVQIDWSVAGLELWRVQQSNDTQATFTVGWVRAKVGLPYDLGHAFFGLFDFKHAEKCTSLVTGPWKAHGRDLMAKAGKFLGPTELAESPQLRRLG